MGWPICYPKAALCQNNLILILLKESKTTRRFTRSVSGILNNDLAVMEKEGKKKKKEGPNC